MQKYTLRDFLRDFPDDNACLRYLVAHRWPRGIYCKRCRRVTNHHLMHTRRSLSCQDCGNHVHPTADTIFHKSTTPLTLWFYVIYLMAQTRGGISAKQVERETGVTYKTAWRMCKMIRARLFDDEPPLGGSVEVDETYIGGRKRTPIGHGMLSKTPVLGMARRGGRVKARVLPDNRADTMAAHIVANIRPGTIVYTDEHRSYWRLPKLGYRHRTIMHEYGDYVDGVIHTNTIEGFWSMVKCGIRGVYRRVSAKYLQGYVNEYAFRYNQRHRHTPMFHLMMRRLAHPPADTRAQAELA